MWIHLLLLVFIIVSFVFKSYCCWPLEFNHSFDIHFDFILYAALNLVVATKIMKIW